MFFEKVLQFNYQYLFISVLFLRRQLKNLKDNLKKCLDKRGRMTKSGASASHLLKCKYFDKMRFLYDKTRNLPTESNFSKNLKSPKGNLNCPPKTRTNSIVTQQQNQQQQEAQKDAVINTTPEISSNSDVTPCSTNNNKKRKRIDPSEFVLN